MNSEERDLITGLFDRLRTADAPGKDQEADDFIRRRVGEQPTAPYLLVQTLLVQENALKGAQTRIAELERQAAEAKARGDSGSGGSFLSGLLGRSAPSSATPPPLPRPSAQPPPPAPAGGGQSFSNRDVPPPLPNQGGGYPPQYAPPPSPAGAGAGAAGSGGGGGSFLRGALGTAAGVAGGALLFSGIQNLLSHHDSPFSGMTGGGGFGGFGGGHFGGGGGSMFGGAGQRGEAVEHNETINNYYGSQGGSAETGERAGTGTEETAEDHSDALMQSSEPVEDTNYASNNDDSGGLTDSDVQDMGFDSGNSGSDDSYADSGGGSDDSYV